MNKDLVKLCVDAYNGVVTNYTKKEQNEVIRKAFVDVIGTDKITPKVFRAKKVEIFEIIEEIVEQTLGQSQIKETPFFEQFVDERNLKLGDSNVFYVPNDSLVTVSKFSGNHWDLNRQRFDAGLDVTVTTEWYGAKMFDYFVKFLAGRIDIVNFIEAIQRSVDKFVGEFIYTSFISASDKLPTQFKYSGSYSEGEILKVVDHVSAANGNAQVMLVATRSAFAKMKGVENDYSDQMKNDKHTLGFIKSWNGIPCMVLPQVHKSNSFEFAFDSNKIFALTNDTKPIKLVNEGDVLVSEISDGTSNVDMSIEYAVQFKIGLAVMFNRLYGTISLT